jgi:hypothetical protein
VRNEAGCRVIKRSGNDLPINGTVSRTASVFLEENQAKDEAVD